VSGKIRLKDRQEGVGMMSYILRIVYTLLPVILAGVCNMILVKLPVLDSLKRPMDGGALCSDGKRLFGANKTWKGFVGMIFLTGFWMYVLGYLDQHLSWARGLSLMDYQSFSPAMEWLYGAIWGLGYVLFELPNSYIKRRLDIPPGQNKKGTIGYLFMFIDQADSVLGCMLFMLVFYVPSIKDAVAIFGLGVIIHYLTNVALYLVGLKKQAG